MAYQIKIDEWVASAAQEQRRIIRSVLEHMKWKKGRDNYASYVPWLDFSLALSRRAAGGALGTLWKECVNEDLPLLNFLITRSDTDLPGSGVMDLYESTFGTLQGYDVWCESHAKLAEYMLQNGLVEIV